MPYVVAGTLTLPESSKPATNVTITFRNLMTVSPLIVASESSVTTSAIGAYSISLQYSVYAVEVTYYNNRPISAGQIVLNSETQTGLDLPTLLNGGEYEPATPAWILQIEAWLAQAQNSATASANSAQAAQAQANASAASAAASAASAAQASQISGLDTVSEAIGLASLPMPDVWAPLSDSLRMITGYGRDALVGLDVVARMVNFSRSSTATYVGKDGSLKTAAANEPRFEKEGLLIEGQSTNLVPNSKNPPPTSSETRVTLVASPYGDVFKFAAATTNNSMKDVRFAQLTAGQLVTLSFIAKKAEIDTVAVGFDWMFSALFNLTSVSVGGVPSGSSATITPIGDGFYRATLTTTTTRDVTPSLRLKVNGTFAANAVGDGMLIGNIQAELLPFASSYIPTNGAAVTRAADQAWLPAAGNRFIGGRYAAAFEFDLLGRVASGVSEFSRLVDFDNSGGSDRQHISLTVGGQLQCLMGPSQTAASVTGKLAGRAAMRMSNFALNVMMDGVAGSSVTASGGGSSANDRIVLMNSNLFNLPSYGHIRNLRMWSKHPISNEQLRTAV